MHLSDVMQREPFRRVSVLDGVCVAKVSGKGVEGYRDALAALKEALLSRADRVAARLPSASSTRCSSPTWSTSAT